MKILSYLVLVLFLAVGGLAVTYYTKSKVQDGKIVVLENDLRATKESLATIGRSIAVSDAAIDQLTQSMGAIDSKNYKVAERIQQLERNNEKIRSLLALPLPADGCLLDDTCPATADVHPAKRGTAATVQPAAGS